MGYRVAILGATGLVGREIVKMLEQRNFPMDSIRLLASERSAGKKMTVAGEKVEVKEAGKDSFKGIDIVLSSVESDQAREFSPIAIRDGAVFIDNSSAFRMEPTVPLVVPEVNGEDVTWHKGLIANPNCSTIQMVVALYPLHKVNPIKRLVIATYQAVSGTGTAAMEELNVQARQVLDGKPITRKVYPHQIAFNCLPSIDVFLDNGYSREERKMLMETQKIMHAPDVLVSATCVRVPVFLGHSEAVNIEFSRPMSPEEARQILSKAPGVKVVDDPAKHLYPMAIEAAGKDDTFVGRIRKDISHPNGLVMWIVSDNIRKGAALNTVQIGEEIVKRNALQGGRK